jgi:hypothetical protein
MDKKLAYSNILAAFRIGLIDETQALEYCEKIREYERKEQKEKIQMSQACSLYSDKGE